jgi:hypothetical protein
MKAFFVFLIPPPEYPSVAYRQVDWFFVPNRYRLTIHNNSITVANN